MVKTVSESKNINVKFVPIVLSIFKNTHQRFTERKYLKIGLRKDIHADNYDFKNLRIKKMS